MISTGFESRIKIQQIIENQIPEFISDENPKFGEFLKQYYISQEYQGGPIDLTDNLDQYLTVDNLIPEVVVGTTTLSASIDSDDTTITVASTKGFPKSYGLLKIDDEVITYTEVSGNTFTGCVRGFSGVTDYHKNLNYEELVFTDSSSASHTSSTTVQNLSALFLQEFYKKLKYSLTPGLEDLDFVPTLNVGNFIKEARTFYETKGTEESFRILFNILFGETPKIIDLEQFLIKPSSAAFVRREIALAEVLSGDPQKLSGQTIFKTTDTSTSASVSEVEIIQRKGKTYYKLFLFVGFDDSFPTITGDFVITGNTKNINEVSVGANTIVVDTTLGFKDSGTIYSGNNEITYTHKNINQFFGCTGITETIPVASLIRSSETYFGYEDGDVTKKVELRLTGVISEYKAGDRASKLSVGDSILIDSVGEVITNSSIERTYKQIFANSLVYNTSSRYQINDNFGSGSISQVEVLSEIDKSSLKVGDRIDILNRDAQTVAAANLEVTSISGKLVTTNNSFTLNNSLSYDLRRRLKTASSTNTSLEFDPTIPEVQNFYSDDEYYYVASNSVPSYEITKSLFSYDASGVDGKNVTTNEFSQIVFASEVSFITGEKIRYTSTDPISGLSEGVYFVEVLAGKKNIRLYSSPSVIGTSSYLEFGSLTSATHNFIAVKQEEKIISGQNMLRKFPATVNINDAGDDVTTPGGIGVLANGVEIYSYKSNSKIYYGPLEKINVLSGGSGFDVLNPPLTIVASDGSSTALAQPVISGSVDKIYVDPQDFDIDVVVSVNLTGGNGTGAVFEPMLERKRREISFDARPLGVGPGGVDFVNDSITFLSNHNLVDGQKVLYDANQQQPLGVGTFNGSNELTGKTLIEDATYYVQLINSTSINLYESLADYNAGINTVGFTTGGNAGVQKFKTEPKNVLSGIKVVNGGTGYTNRKLRVKASGISTITDAVTFIDHGFGEGERVVYSYETTAISGLSTERQYYTIKLDDNTFRLADAGIGGTDITNYQRGNYVDFATTGTGYQIFDYPPISLNVQYTAVGLGSTALRGTINAVPVITGEIANMYVYENGSSYGSEILDFHRKPVITIKNGESAQFAPVVVNGGISAVSKLYAGLDYYSVPEVVVRGDGTGAELRAVVENNKVTNLIIVNPGIGYSTANTTISIVSAGKNAIFDPQIRSLSVKRNTLFNDVSESIDEAQEILISSNRNLQYAVCGYSDDSIDVFGDDGSTHSPIIGWAYDGNPIYGSFGYSDPQNINSTLKRLVPGYSKSSSYISDRPSIVNFAEGYFEEDYRFTDSGDLDEYNGRWCITPEFPEGVYAYFATSILDGNSNNVGVFPYFIGEKYRSRFLSTNKSLNQTFDFNSSSLLRNTFPYKVSEKYADNDFIVESNELISQVTLVESLSKGPVENLKILSAGNNYKVGDSLVIESTGSGGGLSADVSRIKGQKITNLQTNITTLEDSVFVRKDASTIEVQTGNRHDLQNLDYVVVSGFSTVATNLNGYYKIGVSSETAFITAATGKDSDVTADIIDLNVSRIPESVSIGSSVGIGTEIFKLLNVFDYNRVLRVERQLPGQRIPVNSPVVYVPNKFTIQKNTEFFDSTFNDKVNFNPVNAVGYGATVGFATAVTYPIGIQSNKTISIPTQSIFLPNHPFQTNQKVVFNKPNGSDPLSVANTSSSAEFDLPFSGDDQTVYLIRQSSDHIGIVTQIGLTTTTNGLFFIGGGSDNTKYSFESLFFQALGDVKKIQGTVTTELDHDLTKNDSISLEVRPSLTSGIGTATAVSVRRDTLRDKILVDPVGFSSVGVNTSLNQITIVNHGMVTGEKVYYEDASSNSLSGNEYYIFKVDEDTIKLSTTYNDSISNPPRSVSIASTGGASQTLSRVNPKLLTVENNDLKFDLTDASLEGYELKIFYDQEFKNEFVSSGSTNTFNVLGVGTAGISTNAALTLKHDITLPKQLYYALEKSGTISTADDGVIDYSTIRYIDSDYNGNYNVSGITTRTFDISLSAIPENLSYASADCDILEYATKSSSARGGIDACRIISSGNGYDKLPRVSDVISSGGGFGSLIVCESSKIGNVKEINIINEGFDYSSDKTLSPKTTLPSEITLINGNTLDSIEIISGGLNYTVAPDLIIVDQNSGSVIDSGYLQPVFSGSSIVDINIVDQPKGIPSFGNVAIRAINNTNGVGIDTVTVNSNEVELILTTPLSGFNPEPFVVGSKIFVEGLESENGEGLSSKDYGYQFFEVSEYLNAGTNLPRILRYDLSSLTTNAGIAKTSSVIYTNVINTNTYPEFSVKTSIAPFIVGETLSVKTPTSSLFEDQDLIVVEFLSEFIKINGAYKLNPGDTFKGKQSGSIATVDSIDRFEGQFIIKYSAKKSIGWTDPVGQLNNDVQVIPDNDFYQNLSYDIKSKQEWKDIVSPVNNLVHPSGLKNFATTEILKDTSVGAASSSEFTVTLVDILGDNRVDTINNFDLTVDVDTSGDTSKFLKFKNKDLADYIALRTNRVLEIDDISDEFSSFLLDLDSGSTINISELTRSRKFHRFLVQIQEKNGTQNQLTEIIVLNDNLNSFTFEKNTLSSENEEIATISGNIDANGDLFLIFTPTDELNSYNIKALSNEFSTYNVGLGTYPLGFVDITGITTNVTTGVTTTILSKPVDEFESALAQVHVLDNVSNEQNYVEVYLDHNGTEAFISEFFFDSENDIFNANSIGSFEADITNGIISLSYANDTANTITVRSKNVGFGTTAAGISTYRFQSSGQPDGDERSATIESNFLNESGITTIKSFRSDLFSSVKSTVRVSVGETSALHQVMLIESNDNVFVSQYPFLSIGSTTGIGTFGGNLNGTDTELKFYPDSEFSSDQMEILVYNENLYTELDFSNDPMDLTYSNVRESIKLRRYFSPNDTDLQKTDFNLNYQNTPIFAKVFNPNSANVNLDTGIFEISNHFFSTGEELIYTPKSTFISIGATALGIGVTENNEGISTDVLPETVFAIKIDNDSFKLSTKREYANLGIAVTFTSVGSGNAHVLEMSKKNEKALISIDNLIQQPIAFSLVDYVTQENISISTSFVQLSGISSIGLGDVIKVEDEYMKVRNVGLSTYPAGPISFAGTFPLIEVDRGFVGTAATPHTAFNDADLYRGSYNIVESTIHFVDPPTGNLSDELFGDDDGLEEGRASFNGRVFLKKDYQSNVVYDNISENFTGLDTDYEVTVGGSSTTGIGSTGGNGIVILNGIFQAPSTINNPDNNYEIIETVGMTTISFSGITSTNGQIIISEDDVNKNQLPRGGVIVSLGSTPGLGYAPLVGASVTAILSAGEIVSIGIGSTGNFGSGYSGVVSIGVTDSLHNGTEAEIEATVGAGGTLSFNVVNPGTGYVNPSIQIPSPVYGPLSVTGVSRLGIGTTSDTGLGLLLNVDVSAASTTGIGSTTFSVSSFDIVRKGYGFKRGDVFRAVGLVTAYGLTEPISHFEMTVLEVFNDNFASWNFGQMDYIDSIANEQDGTQIRFPLKYNNQLLSFEKDNADQDSQLIDYNPLLLIFVNGILQVPGEAYNFEGGTTFTFTAPPKANDKVDILFYRGSSEDSSVEDVTETIKIGDDVQVFAMNGNYDTKTQDKRVVTNILTSDKIQTNLYLGEGIDETNFKPLYWTKQKVDKVIEGQTIYKTRDSIEPQIYPTAKIIKNVNSNETDIFVDSIDLFNYESSGSPDIDAIIVNSGVEFVSAGVTATVGTGGTIVSLTITEPGSGYSGSTLDISISAPRSIGVGLGSTATARVSISNGSITSPLILEPGLGYNTNVPPQVLVPTPNPVTEIITDINLLQGFDGAVVGIATTPGVNGASLAIAFTLDPTLAPSFGQIQEGYPLVIFDSKVGNEVTSIINLDTEIVAIGTTCVDNIYHISSWDPSTGIATCNILSTTNHIGITSTLVPDGVDPARFTWGRLRQGTRSTSPVSIGVSGYTVNTGLTTFPTVQRRNSGLRDKGPISKTL